MPARGKGQYQKGKQSQLRARFHDYNSVRRFRKQTTVSWQKYKEITQGGKKKFAKGKSK